jgi:two-component system nitrate/nitrite response regulator NarL
MTQIRVLIADRHPLFRDGLARAIDRDGTLRLIAEADEPAAALEAIRRLSPDVAVLDVELDALRILAALAQHRVRTRVALMTAEVRHADAFEAVAAGALGYLSKQVRADIVCDAIRRVAAGDAALCHEAQSVVTAEIRRRHQDDHRLLSPREFDVLQLMAQGLSYAEIGSRLHLAPTTVKGYAAHVYERLGASDRVAAVVEAMRRGLLA